MPDLAVFLTDTQADDRGGFWYGGPDFAVAVLSANDQTRNKIDFYGIVRTHELFLVDLNPWHLDGQQLTPVGTTTDQNQTILASEFRPLTFALSADESSRPRIAIRHTRDDCH